MSNDTPENDAINRAMKVTAEIGALVERSNATIERTREAIRRAREASEADAALARALEDRNDEKPLPPTE